MSKTRGNPDDSSSISHPSFLIARHIVELLAGLYVLFIIQLTLIPFDFIGQLGEGQASALFVTGLSETRVLNVASNVGLFIPLGIALHWAIARRRANSVKAFLGVLLGAGLLSAIVEGIQAYSPSRVSSLIDLFCNVAGAGIGAALSSTCRAAAPKVIGAILCAFHNRPRTTMVQVYAVALVVLALSPFTVAVDGNRLKQVLQSATFTPFAQTQAYAEQAEKALLDNDARGHAMAEMLRQRLWADWLAQGASFVLLAWLLYPVLRNVHQFNEPAASLLVCWIALLFAVGLSVLQTPVMTRGFHITDILMRMAGVFAGLISRRVYDGTIEDWDRARRHNLSRRLARVCFASVCAFILYTGLLPWLQQDGRGHALGALASYEVLPLYSYFHSRFDVMAQDIVQKTTAYVLFGGLLVMSWRRVEAYPLARRVFTVAQAAVALALVIEVAQLYLLIRVTSLTDLLIAALAGGTGVVVQEHAVTFYRFARSKDAVLRPMPSRPAALGPTDELIATLAEEHPEAPTEEVPVRERRLPSRR